MVGASSSLRSATSTGTGESRSVLGWLALAHIVFTTLCSPIGISSGDWAVPGLAVDALAFLAVGAVWVHPMILYPLWLGLGAGSLLPRLFGTILVFTALLSGMTIRGMIRGLGPMTPNLTMLVAASGVVAICSWLILRREWRIGRLVDSVVSTTHNPVQFRLKHLLLCTTLIACALAVCRISFPDGITVTWSQFRGFARAMLGMFILAPTGLLCCLVLADRLIGRYLAVVIGISLLAYEYGLARLWEGLRYGDRQELLWLQLGACVAGLTSAVVMRCHGYRVSRCR